MKLPDEIPISDLIVLYYQKHHAIHHGDIHKLRDLKNQHPEIFDAAIDAQVRDIINNAKKFELTESYKQLRQHRLKKELKIIKNDSTEC